MPQATPDLKPPEWSFPQEHDMVQTNLPPKSKWKTFYTYRPDWNRFGPRIPTWFKARFKKEFPGFVLQFIPPRCLEVPNGVNPEVYPNGVWDVCKRLKRTKYLHPRFVWSLADTNGNYSIPGHDTLRLLRMSLHLQRLGQVHKIEDEIDRVTMESRRNMANDSRNELHTNLQRSLKLFKSAQWTNRASFRRVTESDQKRSGYLRAKEGPYLQNIEV